jgi:hypothetical protein
MNENLSRVDFFLRLVAETKHPAGRSLAKYLGTAGIGANFILISFLIIFSG